jgi:cysteine desulfurase
MRQVYLDHQSATPVLPEVIEAMRPFLAGHFGNPSSLHKYGLQAREAIAAAREKMAALVHAGSPEEIIFTSDGTESANLAVKGVAYANQRRGNHIVISQTEHPSVIRSVEFLEKQGFTSTRVKVDGQGFVDPADVQAAITDKTVLVVVHLVNHDTGTIEPVREISEITGQRGIPLYVDAEAGAGWFSIDVNELGADLLSFSPHRFYGPKGVGVLYRNRRARLSSILHGGEQENGWRAGIENVPGIVGAGVAAEIALGDGAKWREHCRKLQERLWNGIKKSVPYVRLNGPEPGPKRSPTNLNFSTEFIDGESQVLLLDTNGIAASGPTNCVTKSLKVPSVLRAIGLPDALAQAAIILSLGKDNSDNDIDYVIETFSKIVGKLRGMSPAWDEFEKGAIDSLISPRQKHTITRD